MYINEFFSALVTVDGGYRELPSEWLQSWDFSFLWLSGSSLRLGAIWEGRGWNVIPVYSLTQFQHSFWNRTTYWIYLQAWRVIFCDAGRRPEIARMHGGICWCWMGLVLTTPPLSFSKRIACIIYNVQRHTMSRRSALLWCLLFSLCLIKPQNNIVALIRSFVFFCRGH